MVSESDTPETQSRFPGVAWRWLALALFPLVFRLLFAFVETDWWGLNSLAFTGGRFFQALIVWIIILLVFLLIERLLKRDILQTIPQRLPSLTGRLTAPLLAISLGALSFVLAQNSHLFGDGYALIGALAQRDELYAHPLTYLATKTVAASYLLFENLTDRALDNSAMALNTLSALCGALTVWIWLKITAKVTRGKTEQLFLFSGALFSGASLVFFGDGEFYAPAVAIVSLIVLSFVTMINAESTDLRYKAAGSLILLSVFAPLYLAQLIFIIPATVFMLGLGLAPGPKRERLWGILSLLILIAIVAVIYWQAQSDLWLKARIVGLSGKPPEFDYSLFSARRLFDILNTSFILWPLFPLTIWLCLRYVWRERCDHIVGGLAMLTLSFSAWIFIGDFPAGSAREITTVALFALPASFLAAYVWLKRLREAPWFGRTTVAIGLTAALSFFTLAQVYVVGEAGVEYLDHDYQQRQDRYLSGLVDFRDHYYFKQKFSKADKWEWSFSSKSPAFLDHRSIRLLYGRGDYAEALDRLALLMSTNPYWATLYSTKAAALQAMGRNAEALHVIDSGLQLTPGDVSMLTVRGNILRTLKAPDSAEAQYLKALRYDSRNSATRKDLGLFYIERGNTLEAEREGYLIFEDDPKSSYPFLLVGLAAFDRQEYDRARRYLTVAINRGQKTPETRLARFVLDRLEKISSK